MAFSPRISGRALRAIHRLSRTAPGARLLYQIFRSDLRIGQLEALPDALFGDMPVDNRPRAGRPPREGQNANLPPTAPPWSRTSATLTAAYASKKTTPREVVDAGAGRGPQARRARAERRSAHGVDRCERAP